MLKEVTDSIKLTLYDRATSPMAGIFILSWLAFNWRIPMVLFLSEESIEKRISYISSNYLDDPNIYLYYPAAIASAIMICYPFISLAPFYWWQKAASIKTKLKQKIDKSVLLTVEQSEAIKNELFKLKEFHRTELSQHENENSRQLDKIKHINQEKDALKEQYKNKISEKDDRIREIELAVKVLRKRQVFLNSNEATFLPVVRKLLANTLRNYIKHKQEFDIEFFNNKFSDQVFSEQVDDTDISSTQLDLAKVYIEMEDFENAKVLLEDLLPSSSPDIKKEAEAILFELDEMQIINADNEKRLQ